MAIDLIGLSSRDISDRKNCVVEAWNAAQGKYVMDAIVRHTSQDLLGLLTSAIAMVVGAALVIIIGNVGGAAIGGALGSLAGGVGAAPGAAAGRALGNYIAQAFLTLLGVGLLIQFIASELGGIGEHFYKALDCAWNSPGFGTEIYGKRIDFSARHFAEGIGKFFGALVMGLVIVLTRRSATEKAKIFSSKLTDLCNGLETYIVRNLKPLEAKYQNGLVKATVTENLPETPEDIVKQEKAAALAPKPFADMPSFYRRKVGELQRWLDSNGFEKKAEVRRPGDTKPGGGTYSDFQSEIWMRQRGNTIECVRLDPDGHTQFKVRDGPVRIEQNPTTGEWSSRRIAWGERPHYHMEVIDPSKAVTYLSTYVPEAVAYEMNGRAIPEMQQWHKGASDWATRVFGQDGELAKLVDKFCLIHIPLSGD